MCDGDGAVEVEVAVVFGLVLDQVVAMNKKINQWNLVIQTPNVIIDYNKMNMFEVDRPNELLIPFFSAKNYSLAQKPITDLRGGRGGGGHDKFVYN